AAGQNQPQPALTLEPVGDLLPFFQRHRLVVETNTQRLRLIDQLNGEDKLPPNTTLSTAVQYIVNQGHQNVRIAYHVQGPIAVLWTNAAVSTRTDLFGDDQYSFLVDVNADGQPSSAARAIRAADGVAIPLPDFSEPYQRKLRVAGRTILTRDETPQGDLVLRL